MGGAREPSRRPPQWPGEEGIVRAAIAVMAENGYHGTPVRDIAVRASTTRTSPSTPTPSSDLC